MATTIPVESTRQARNSAQKAMAVNHVQRIDGLSRIVDRDIEILKMNVQLHDGRDETRTSAWERLESAWETVRSELADDSASSPLTGDASSGNDAAAAAVEVDAPMAVVRTVPLALRPRNWVTEVLGPAISSRSRTSRALVTRARAPCGTPCRGVEGLELRQQRSVSRCEAGEQWEARVARRSSEDKRIPWRARGHPSKANRRQGKPPDLSLPRSKLRLARSKSFHRQLMRPVYPHQTIRPPSFCRRPIPTWLPARNLWS